MAYNPPHTTKMTARRWGVMCKMYAGVCKILWTYPTLLKHLYINLLRTKSVRWQWKHTHSFTRRLTGRVQIFGYKLHTSFDGCNASASPLQRFYTKPICVGDYCYPVKPLWYYGSRIAPIARIFLLVQRAITPRRWRIWRILWALHAHFAISSLLRFLTT